MLTMTELHNLRKLYFEEGKNITEISRETGRDRKTVRLYLEKEDWNDVRRGSIAEVEFPKLDPFKADIDTWLMEDKSEQSSEVIDRRYLRMFRWTMSKTGLFQP